ncbi:maleylpyruvate isomerase family mycothiol-dependent enzyme [Nocardia blacklockiae]|uniref:maleylpyruvate isomerase family mycothiol-dependent enzyme n=1 Tax=Nocardia blacklockiae TaxID=480036 RepID=UPI001895FABF|nr:maleylpyruvate isomerase family mycothiol-dependent enzyme [Nocardia blacklockiae]MBF6173009.1 maleylpyruvate isomerase family mycothiol-dependent enzyme [Nocardia blacklockiae]
MDRETSWQHIEQQRRAIADLLADLTPAQWETPSLCAGWRIREVAAHLAMTPEPPTPLVMLRTGLRVRGDYNRFIDELTRAHAARPTGELVAQLRANAASRRLPKLTNYRNALFDTIVHGQDIALPLGRSLAVAPAAAAAAAERAARVGRPVWNPHRLNGVHLRADDVEWEYGTGGEVRGPIVALLLLITGRTALLDQLSGDGIDRLVGQLA